MLAAADGFSQCLLLAQIVLYIAMPRARDAAGRKVMPNAFWPGVTISLILNRR